MSGINGDKSRFHRERKQKIARRGRTRDLVKSLATGLKATRSTPNSKPQPVAA
jgi:hypothetical protein